MYPNNSLVTNLPTKSPLDPGNVTVSTTQVNKTKQIEKELEFIKIKKGYARERTKVSPAKEARKRLELGTRKIWRSEAEQ